MSKLLAARGAKDAMRRELSARTRALEPEAVARAASRATEWICASPEYAAAETLVLYAALPDEMPTRPLFDAARRAGKRTLLPTLSSADRLRFVQVEEWRRLRKGRFGVLEPDPSAGEVALGAAHLVIVPGRAFSVEGHRLGRGRGCYDRALAEAARPPATLGLCFSCQLVAELPWEAHDQRVCGVATEEGILRVPAG